MAARVRTVKRGAPIAACATLLFGQAALASADLTRGVRIMNPPIEAPGPVPPDKMPPLPVETCANGAPMKKPGGPPIRIAASDGLAARFNGMAPLESPFEVVAPTQQPDVTWDAGTRDVTAAGDVIAHDINSSDLPQVVDRMAAIRAIKQMSSQAPLLVKLIPDLKVHGRGATVDLTIDDVQGRALIVLDLAGDGTVQTLYPGANEPQIHETAQYRQKLVVRSPFGSDQLVAISAPQAVTDFEQALKMFNEQRASGKLAKLLSCLGATGIRIGSVAFNTAP